MAPRAPDLQAFLEQPVLRSASSLARIFSALERPVATSGIAGARLPV